MNDNELYPIGDAARRTGLSVSAIRFYADAGVLAPTRQTDTGHRFYDIDAIARLELVRTLRDLGASLDHIRGLLAEETSLAELAATHLDLLEGQLRDLHARRAVLRTIVNQPTTTERVALMHRLVSMSDEHRNRLLDEFWQEVTHGLTVDPAFVEHLYRLRPQLPEEPATEQLQAWIELADLVRDKAFRDSVRQYFHTSFASPKAVELTAPPRLARLEKHLLIEVEAGEAERSGLSPESPRAREIAERLLASIAELTADATGAPLNEHDLAELRHSMTNPDPTSAAHRHAAQAVAGFTGLLTRYLSLMATINGTPQPDAEDAGVSEEWLAAALAAPGR
ncbi:helix-turn-helix domain-containing protein [Crossiella sp. NPDC003009]